jgi:hypothetical protein
VELSDGWTLLMQVAYYGKMQQEAGASQVITVPCSSTFPGAPAAGAATVTSTITVNATFAGKSCLAC